MEDEVKTVEKGSQILQQHDEWLTQHLDELIEQYPGKVVAISSGKIVKVGETYQEVYQAFISSNVEWMPMVISVPYPDEVQEFLL
ncbi:DUF5678 domain-containing protein [Chroococcus sp. FPU101]|uniref:DUF5678 domain-containing protein n=1 Tax=Chroococcus sp. FPU101 TaxID=1974212 RepID=UPI001A8F778A|nr:DUF5678 domain-containing protein [Chroococcus sp. FPU101]GFE69060.1 hypothetical protein CFPU101_16700 [Chroococcus sp. FPU101]